MSFGILYCINEQLVFEFMCCILNVVSHNIRLNQQVYTRVLSSVYVVF